MQGTKILSMRHFKQLFNTTLRNHVRNISTSTAKYGSFKVQDDKEFLEKVQNSKEPVIVDFFAS